MDSTVIPVSTLGFMYISEADFFPVTVVATAPVPSPAVVLTASVVSISKSPLDVLDVNVTTAEDADVVQLGYCASSTADAISLRPDPAARTVTPSNTKVSAAAQVLANVTVNASLVPDTAFQGKNAQSPFVPPYNHPNSIKPLVYV